MPNFLPLTLESLREYLEWNNLKTFPYIELNPCMPLQSAHH